MDQKVHEIGVPFGSIKLHYQNGLLTKVDYTSAPLKEKLEERDKTREDKALEKYLDGDIYALKDWPIAKVGTDFRRKVWKEICKIPPGRTCTYGEIAERLHSSARAVGQAVGDNPLPIFVPCHRVVGKHGFCGFGHSQEGIKIQKFLLEHEKRFLNEQKRACVGNTCDSLVKEKQNPF